MNNDGKRIIAVFDFDGTLTTKDTLLEFIKFACGVKRFYWGVILFSPILLLMKLHLYPNGKTKERLFSFFFKGWDYEQFAERGRAFSHNIQCFRREKIVRKLEDHIKHEDTVYVITASIEEWVRPWCLQIGVAEVIGTKIEVKNGIVTGRFLTENCYGKEKVNRLMRLEPLRASYVLYSYGDSKGDKEIIALSDYGEYVS